MPRFSMARSKPKPAEMTPIDPAVGEIEEVYLYDIDALEQLATEARGRRQKQIEECEKIIETELAKLRIPGL